jgi:MFS family permease
LVACRLHCFWLHLTGKRSDMPFAPNVHWSHALRSTIVSTALPRIGSDFNQMSIVSWVATAYILTFDAFRKSRFTVFRSNMLTIASIEPLFSKFSDIFGRKWVLIFGIVIFLLGSVLCGAAKV